MSSPFSDCKTSHGSPSSLYKELTCDSVGVVLSQSGCLTQEQVQTGETELGLMEMSEVEYTHLHFIQSQVEAHAAPPDRPNARSLPVTVIFKDGTGSMMTSPFTTTQAVDLSMSGDQHYLEVLGEKTPASYNEVPCFVLSSVKGEHSPTEPHANSSTSSPKQSRPAARVCLEKRFKTMAAESDTPRQQDIQSAVPSNFLTILQQSADTQEAVKHPQMQKWMKSNRANPLKVIGHVPHMVEPKHQSLIIPKSFPSNFYPERVVRKAHYTSGSNATEEQQLLNIENVVATSAAGSWTHGCTYISLPIRDANAAPESAEESGSSTRKRAPSHMSHSLRRERHNSKERERRKMIRSYCDELNMLVPFCRSDSDKVTTLQWTTAFLRYINKAYGDIFKEEFKKAFTDEKGVCLKSSSSSGQNPIHQEMDETLSIPLAIEP